MRNPSMVALARMFWETALAGTIAGLLVAGAVGILRAVPLAFLELLPGDDLAQLQSLPRILLFCGMGGFMIGALGGFASHLTGQRINSIIATLLIGVAAILTANWTHPHLNLELDSGWLDYLESYRLTLLASLAATAGVVGLGVLVRPFARKGKEA